MSGAGAERERERKMERLNGPRAVQYRESPNHQDSVQPTSLAQHLKHSHIITDVYTVIRVIYGCTTGTGTPTFGLGYRTPTFQDIGEEFAVIRGDLWRLNYT